MLLSWYFPRIYQAIHPCKRKQRGLGRKRAALAAVCLCRSAPWEVIDPYRPFAHMLGRRGGNNKDFCSFLTAWPLVFPSVDGQEPCSCQTYRAGLNETWWQARLESTFYTANYTEPFMSWSYINVFKDTQSILSSTSGPQVRGNSAGVNSVPDVNLAFNCVKKCPECWRPWWSIVSSGSRET